MANRFYTIMIVPEKTSQVRRLIVPSWLVKTTAIATALLTLLGLVMLLDYWYVMNQINENKELRMENRRLRQQVQIYKNKMTTIESTLDRIKTFATRLKVITNIEDRANLLQSLKSGKLPDANTNIGTPNHNNPNSDTTEVAQQIPVGEILPPLVVADALDPESLLLRKEHEELDDRFRLLARESLDVEQLLQDQYELLADQRSFLAAFPTRKPAVGYFTSGFGVRRSPLGGRIKMHEGLDIANHPGTPIKAPAEGMVVFADTKAGYGRTVILDHGYGLETWYGHTHKLLVKKGQKVNRGEPIALLGNSGRSTGPHLHYEVRIRGTPVDPLSYILED